MPGLLSFACLAVLQFAAAAEPAPVVTRAAVAEASPAPPAATIYPEVVQGRYGAAVVVQVPVVPPLDTAAAYAVGYSAAQAAAVKYAAATWVTGGVVDPASWTSKLVCPGGGKPCTLSVTCAVWQTVPAAKAK